MNAQEWAGWIALGIIVVYTAVVFGLAFILGRVTA